MSTKSINHQRYDEKNDFTYGHHEMIDIGTVRSFEGHVSVKINCGKALPAVSGGPENTSVGQFKLRRFGGIVTEIYI